MVLAVHLYKRLMRKGRVISLLALASVPGFVYWLAGFDSDPADQGALYSDIITNVGYTYAIAVLILTVATLREERDGGTLPYIYMRPIPRVTLAIWSIIAGIAAALTIAVGGWLATVLATLAVGADLPMTLPGLSLFVAAAVGYAAIFVPLGYLVPRSLLVGLGYIIVIESILAEVVTGLAQFSIWRISVSIYADLATVLGDEAIEALGSVSPGVGGGVLKLTAALVVGLITLTLALQRRDVL